jgi:hypothetical protein
MFIYSPFNDFLSTNRGAEACRINMRYKNREETIFGMPGLRKAFLFVVSFFTNNSVVKSVGHLFIVLEVQNTNILSRKAHPKAAPFIHFFSARNSLEWTAQGPLQGPRDVFMRSMNVSKLTNA